MTASTLPRRGPQNSCKHADCLPLQIVEEVASAQNTIELLLPQGDFADALDVLDSLKTNLSSQHTTGMHAFYHLPSQITDIAEVMPYTVTYPITDNRTRSIPQQALRGTLR
jgi:hypothetical protein